MTNKFASTKRAIAECDVCGFQFKLRELRSKVVRGRDTNILACPECFDGDHPQNKQGMFPVEDPQAIRNPRPPAHLESSRNVQWGWNPVGDAVNNFNLRPNNLSATGAVGEVTVTTS